MHLDENDENIRPLSEYLSIGNRKKSLGVVLCVTKFYFSSYAVFMQFCQAVCQATLCSQLTQFHDYSKT